MKHFTVAQLKAALEGVPDDMPVVLCGIKDHTYIEASSARSSEVGAKIKGTYHLYYGDFETWYEDDTERDPQVVNVKAFIIG